MFSTVLESNFVTLENCNFRWKNEAFTLKDNVACNYKKSITLFRALSSELHADYITYRYHVSHFDHFILVSQLVSELAKHESIGIVIISSHWFGWKILKEAIWNAFFHMSIVQSRDIKFLKNPKISQADFFEDLRLKIDKIRNHHCAVMRRETAGVSVWKKEKN